MDIKKEKTKINGFEENETNKKRRKGFAKTAYGWAVFAALGYFLGTAQLPFGARPFGLALICSAKAYTLPALTGAILSAIGSPQSPVYITAYLAAALARAAISLLLELSSILRGGKDGTQKRSDAVWLSLFGEPLALRTLTAAASAFLLSLYFVIQSEFLLYYIYSAIISSASCALAVPVWKGFAEAFEQRGSYLLDTKGSFSFKLLKEKSNSAPSAALTLGDSVKLLAFMSLSAFAALGAKGLSVFGISVSVLIAMLLTLSTVKYRSLLEGALLGALCGLAIDPLTAPVFVFGAIAFGFLSPISVFLGTLGAFAVGLWWGFYSQGLSALSSLLPALLASSLLFTVLDGLLSSYRAERSKKDEKSNEADSPKANSVSTAVSKEYIKDIAAREISELRARESSRELERISTGLNALSDKLYEMSKLQGNTLKENGDLYGICEKAFDSACGGCSQRTECRAECEFSEEIGIIGGTVRRDGHAQSSSVGEKLRARCNRLPDILDEINYNSALWKSLEQERDFTEFFALDYKILSALISSSEKKIFKEYEPDFSIGDKTANSLCEELSDKLKSKSVSVTALGKRKKRFVISVEYNGQSTPEKENGKSIGVSAKDNLCTQIKNILSSAYGVKLSLKEAREENGFLTVICEQSPRVSVSFEGCCSKAEGEEIYCGDSYGTNLDMDEGKFIAFISDGMGCGREASEASRITSLFLQNLLPISYHCEQTVQMLNSFLRRRGNDSLKECSATLDLAEIDLLSSKAVFYKSGAAPTYILRGDNVFKIRARTIPIGIISEVDIKRIELDLYDGDIIVMVSDGVTQGKEECPRLFELLKNNKSADVKRISELVLKYALDNGAKDDISVLALRVNAD